MKTSIHHPLSENMRSVLNTIKETTNPDGRISGYSIAAWLNKSRHNEGVRESLKALTRRGLIERHSMDDPNDEFRIKYPDWLKSKYSIVKETV